MYSGNFNGLTSCDHHSLPTKTAEVERCICINRRTRGVHLGVREINVCGLQYSRIRQYERLARDKTCTLMGAVC